MKTLLAGIFCLFCAVAIAAGGGGSGGGGSGGGGSGGGGSGGGGSGGGGSGNGGKMAPAAQINTQQQLQQVERLVKAKQWSQAEAILKDLRRNAAGSADVWNWSGYVARKSGRLPDAFPYYYKALNIEPDHLGAHEYLGEAHLQNGDRQRAQDQLSILQKLCGQCEQEQDLAQALSKR